MPQISSSYLVLPGVISLISFLAYGTQILFFYIKPSPLESREAYIYNSLIGCIWITYARACFTEPGSVPSEWGLDGNGFDRAKNRKKPRWCRKCEAFKPPRAHHCKICSRCVPKMDHHCPWTVNCVSHRTFPHFFRFLFYAVASMIYLEYFIYIRLAVIWAGRDLPSYLGPSPTQMVFLFVFLVLNSVTLFALAILLARNVWCLGVNVTTIEGWEIERHETLVRRAKALGGYLDGPDGIKVRITRQEFPYDVGILRNMVQGMGGTPLLWFWPFAATPSNQSGLDFETNGFEGPSSSWPPPDPDRIPKRWSHGTNGHAFTHEEESLSNYDQIQAFHRRQQEDMKRFDQVDDSITRRRPFRERYSTNSLNDTLKVVEETEIEQSSQGEEAWRDSEGDRLDDFGIDEDVEFYDEDDTPLAELIRRRRETAMPFT